MKLAWFLLLTSAAFGQTTAADQASGATGAVAGVVTDAVTHVPVKKTVVSINPAGNFNGQNPGSQAVTTDASGAFAFANLQAGKYRVTFQQQNYPQARFGGTFKMVEVKTSETTPPLSIELVPGAAVSGHITDEDGDPLQNCNVQLHPSKNPQQGASMLGNSPTDPDGVYRLSGIAAGKYILSARCNQPLFQPRPFSSGPVLPPTRGYPTLYYPLTLDSKSADVVELTPGNEKSGIDFQMKPAPVTQVRGAFAPGGADWHGTNLAVLLVPLDQLLTRVNAGVDAAKGTFEFRQVFAGSYTLVAFTNGSEDNRIGAAQRIDIGEQPLNVLLELRAAMELSGKVEIESSGNTANPVLPSQIQLMLNSSNQLGMMQPQPTQPNEDGTFTLKGILPGTWQLRANGPRMFLKSVWLGSTDVTSAPMDLSNGAAGALRVVISTNTATIRGSAPALTTVWLAEGLNNRITQADQSGQYQFDGLAPGKYRLVVESGAGPPTEEGAQEVTVKEGETAMIDLKAQN